MKKEAILLAFLALLLLVGCDNHKGESSFFPKTRSLKGVFWNISDSLFRIRELNIAGNYLVLVNANENNQLSMINLSSHSQIFNFCKRGEGPQELLSVDAIFTEDSCVNVYEHNRKEMARFYLDSIEAGNTNVMEKVSFQNAEGFSDIIGFPKGNMWIGCGTFSSLKRFCLSDINGEVISYMGDFPTEKKMEELPFWVLGQAYYSRLCAQPGGNRFAIATSYGEVLQFYECDFGSQTIKEINQHIGRYPSITTSDYRGTPNFTLNRDSKFGYYDICATTDRVYALYSGLPVIEDGHVNGSWQVHEFDWEGNPICCYYLDAEAYSIACRENVLYLCVKNASGEDDIEEYKLDL